MAWTAKQIAAAKKMHRAPGNRKSWPECIKAVTKGTAKKATVSGKKKAAKVSVKKTVIKRPRTVIMAGAGSVALRELNDTVKKLEAAKRKAEMPAGSMAGMTAKDKAAQRRQREKDKQYVRTLQAHVRNLKKFI